MQSDQVNSHSDKTIQIYVIAGIEGVGKSYFAKSLVKKHPELYLVDADEYYNNTSKYNDACEVWLTIMTDIRAHEKAGQACIVVCNGLTRSERDQFTIWFPKVELHLLWFFDQKDDCREGTLNRVRQVPKDTFERDWARMEWPAGSTDKGWISITYVLNDKKHEPQFFTMKGPDLPEIFRDRQN